MSPSPSSSSFTNQVSAQLERLERERLTAKLKVLRVLASLMSDHQRSRNSGSLHSMREAVAVAR